MRLPVIFARASYFGIQKARREPVDRVLAELERSQWFSREKLEDIQWYRLKRLIEHAYRHVPFYKKRLDDIGMEPEDIQSPADIKNIPLLTKADVQRNAMNLMSKCEISRPSTLASTSGSSGTPLKIYRDNESWAYLHANIFRGLSWYGIKVGAPYAMVGGIGTGLQNYIKGRLKDLALNRIHLYASDISEKKCKKFLLGMQKFRPDYIYGYPTAIYDLACMAHKEMIQFTRGMPQLVVVHGEELEPHQREKIEKVFRTTVANSYGCAEVGLLGFQCPQGSLHVPIESVFLEVQNGSTVVTDLFSFAAPMIRYDLGDTLHLMPDKCSCARGLPLFENLKGKLRQVIELRSGRRVHTVFFNSLFKDLAHMAAPIEKYQIVRKEGDQFLVRLQAWDKLDKRITDLLFKRLLERFGEDCRFELQIVDNIERTHMGKYITYYEQERISVDGQD